MPSAILDESGRITLPWEMRDAMRFQTGDCIHLTQTDDGFVLVSKAVSVRALKDSIPNQPDV
jgi:bifunctional DNA-binding transcriptional regulator/antitoxin component of YhaV-PrlF toxin-antitoxin module